MIDTARSFHLPGKAVDCTRPTQAASNKNRMNPIRAGQRT